VDPHVIFSSWLGLVATPKLLALMLLAIALGIFFGCVPGLGGKLGVVLLIPFVYDMDPLPGASEVSLLGMTAGAAAGKPAGCSGAVAADPVRLGPCR
jgi:TctA family transporter